MRVLLLCLAAAASAQAYVHSLAFSGVAARRQDVAGIQFLLGANVAPGLLNAAGTVWITADSDPLAAVKKALQSWTDVRAAGIVFKPLETTLLTSSVSDGPNVILFADTPDNDEVLNGSIAVTDWYSVGDSITRAEILFGSKYQFSTTGAAHTFDLQAILTHEMGHALGADHSGTLGATMFQYSLEGSGE